MVRSTPEVLHE